MNKFDLQKNQALKLAGQLKQSGTPDRFGTASQLPDRREQRKLDQAAGLVPFPPAVPSPCRPDPRHGRGARRLHQRDRGRTAAESAGRLSMHIWVDADACPVVVKDILFRAAQRAGLPLTLVANQPLRTPPSPLIRAVQVPRGFDVADAHITQHAEAGDLVITADIPLAADVLAKGAMALSPRGERYDAGTIRERLAMRDMMEELRSSGWTSAARRPLSQADRRAFASQLDAILARAARAAAKSGA